MIVYVKGDATGIHSVSATPPGYQFESEQANRLLMGIESLTQWVIVDGELLRKPTIDVDHILSPITSDKYSVNPNHPYWIGNRRD